MNLTWVGTPQAAETRVTRADAPKVLEYFWAIGGVSRQELTKFDYAICLAAALCYLMIHQQDPVGLMTFDKQLRTCLPARKA